jgi:hypothetical protein
MLHPLPPTPRRRSTRLFNSMHLHLHQLDETHAPGMRHRQWQLHRPLLRRARMHQWQAPSGHTKLIKAATREQAPPTLLKQQRQQSALATRQPAQRRTAAATPSGSTLRRRQRYRGSQCTAWSWTSSTPLSSLVAAGAPCARLSRRRADG